MATSGTSTSPIRPFAQLHDSREPDREPGDGCRRASPGSGPSRIARRPRRRASSTAARCRGGARCRRPTGRSPRPGCPATRPTHSGHVRTGRLRDPTERRLLARKPRNAVATVVIPFAMRPRASPTGKARSGVSSSPSAGKGKRPRAQVRGQPTTAAPGAGVGVSENRGRRGRDRQRERAGRALVVHAATPTPRRRAGGQERKSERHPAEP